ncbi:MAG: SpoIIE family protein phosphatase [Variovorax sp.]
MLLQALSRELEIGQRIQKGFLPNTMPELAGWDLAGRCTPARKVSGDFYDAFLLPSGTLALVIADVCDKDVGAALYMALFRTLLRAMSCHASASEPSAGTLLRTVTFTNDYIATVHGRENMFATVFFAILDPRTGRLDYLNAGQDAPVIRRFGGGPLLRLQSSSNAVGLLPGISCAIETISLEPGDSLVAFTDSVTDAIGESGAFGEAALLHLIAADAPQDALGVLEGIHARLAQHVGSSSPRRHHSAVRRSGTACAARAGSVTVKQVPRSVELRTVMSPSIISQSLRLMASPRPVPPLAARRGRVGLDEGLEQLGQLCLRHADPGVADLEDDIDGRVVNAAAHDHPHLALVRELGRIGQHIQEHLTNARRISEHVLQSVLTVQHKPVAVLFHQRLHGRRHLVHQLPQSEALDVQLGLPGFDLRQVQHIVDEPEQVLARAAVFCRSAR